MNFCLGRFAAFSALVGGLGCEGELGAAPDPAVGAASAAGASAGGASSGGSGNGGLGAGGANPSMPGQVNGCTMFPGADDWNRDISRDPVDATWTSQLMTMVGDIRIHPDFGVGYGIPINRVPASQAAVPVTFDGYADESDPGLYPFPDASVVRIEGGTPSDCSGDCHVLVIQSGACVLYEGYACSYSGGWRCSNGAKWDLTKVSYGQRPKGWTSADAAGLPIAPGLLRVDEVRAGRVTHAIRFTVRRTQPYYVAPATHQAGSGDSSTPPMGLRVRMKADFDVSGLSPSAQVVAEGMKTYGMIIADNGSNFFFQGEDDPGWTDEDIEPLKTIPASAFEVIVPPPLER
jgi:hypothetical protein